MIAVKLHISARLSGAPAIDKASTPSMALLRCSSASRGKIRHERLDSVRHTAHISVLTLNCSLGLNGTILDKVSCLVLISSTSVSRAERGVGVNVRARTGQLPSKCCACHPAPRRHSSSRASRIAYRLGDYSTKHYCVLMRRWNGKRSGRAVGPTIRMGLGVGGADFSFQCWSICSEGKSSLQLLRPPRSRCGILFTWHEGPISRNPAMKQFAEPLAGDEVTQKACDKAENRTSGQTGRSRYYTSTLDPRRSSSKSLH